MVAYLIKKHKPHLTTFHIYSVDHASHVQGRDGDLVRKAVAGADHAVGNILEAIEQAGIKDQTTVIVTGDHGFADIHKSLSPNVMLLKNGIISDTTAKSNWKAKFHTSGASAFLHLKEVGDIKTLNQVRKLLNAMPEDQKKLFRVLERKELDVIGADPNVLLALAPIEGISMSSTIIGTIIKPAQGGTHGFFPNFKNIETGFIASGPELIEAGKVSEMGLEDIAPIISKILNLDMTEIKSGLQKEVFTKK
jgi:predicted AlkP superfamily pyrophosphatase or phosphodiesterase